MFAKINLYVLVKFFKENKVIHINVYKQKEASRNCYATPKDRFFFQWNSREPVKDSISIKGNFISNSLKGKHIIFEKKIILERLHG